MKTNKKRSGYVALIAVLIIGAVVLDIAVSSTIISIIHNKNGLLGQSLAQATALSSACGEKALMDLKENEEYLGGETINLGNGTCNILPIDNLGGQVRIIKVVGSVNNAVRKTKIEISTINPEMTITTWQEVSDF